MMMALDFLYQYITAPKHTLKTFKDTKKPTLFTILLALLLPALANLSLGASFTPLLSLLATMTGYAFFTLVQSVIQDLIAQTLGGKSQSLRLFKWNILSNIYLKVISL